MERFRNSFTNLRVKNTSVHVSTKGVKAREHDCSRSDNFFRNSKYRFTVSELRFSEFRKLNYFGSSKIVPT